MSATRARLSLELVAAAVDLVRTACPELETGRVPSLVVEVARSNSALRQLRNYLTEHPDGLTTGRCDAPRSVERLVALATEHGVQGLRAPVCADCRRPRHRPYLASGGRVCRACYHRNHNLQECCRCHRVREVAHRSEHGPLCHTCHAHDRREPCAGCEGLFAVAFRLEDGRGLCQMCRPHRIGTCPLCGGADRRLNHTSPQGHVCTVCYMHHLQPRRVCGRCGRERAITRAAQGEDPDLCAGCYRGPVRTCPGCGRTRAYTGALCDACRPRPQGACTVCERTTTVAVTWPRGPVCGACYRRLRQHPQPCPACGSLRPMVARDDQGREVCGPCVGTALDYACTRCGTVAAAYEQGRCISCVRDDRVHALLSDASGQVSEPLAGVARVLKNARSAQSVVRWLLASRSARLLGELADTGRAITHEDLDALPPSRYERYVRHLLVHAAVLPRRDDDLDRIPVWLEHLLADHPPAHARLIRPWTHWHLLHRARRRPGREHHRASRAGRVRRKVRVSLEFLTWLDTHGVALDALGQGDVDAYLSAHPTRGYEVASFLDWTARRSLTPAVTVPQRPRALPVRYMDQDQRRRMLARCLDEETWPVRSRLAGALVLLFGLPATQIRHLRTDQVRTEDGHTYLDLDTHALFIPPKLATLLHRQVRDPYVPLGTLAPEPERVWLFPGGLPGMPVTPSRMSEWFVDMGMASLPARNAALVALLADLPAAVLADLVGMHVNTATRWASIARREWNDYLAAHADTVSSPAREPDDPKPMTQTP